MPGDESALDRRRAEGHRMTPKRLSVLDAVAGHPGHIGVDEVWNWAREQHPYVDLATIYRTLQLLKRLGMVTEVVIGNKLHFELADRHTRHNHMVCSECESVQTLTPGYLAEFSQRLQQEFGFTPDLDKITIGGMCSYCQSAD